MFHPLKPWKRPFSQIVALHNVVRYNPDFVGGGTYPFPTDPLDYYGDASTLGPLAGSANFVTDQRASGGNAVLWRDPSWVL